MTMHLALQPQGSSFVAEVASIRLWEPLDQAVVDELDELWSTRGVLVFRRQALSEDELVAFSRRFGEPERIVRQDWTSEHCPEVIRISNLRNQAGDPIGGLGSGELAWHSDQSYMAHPATGSVLYMVEKPRQGGHTYWANLRLAYEALSPDMQTRLDDQVAIFSYAKRQAGYDEDAPLAESVRRQTPDVRHALVNAHPLTGTKSLYLDPSAMVGIEGMSESEGRQLLDILSAHATQPAFVYRHEWQIGDVVMWDNGFMLHRRDPYDASQSRLLKRTTIRLSPSRHTVPRPA
jgi:taurine dioxygenase